MPESTHPATDITRLWSRFQARPRWQRLSVYGAAAVVGLGGIAAATSNPEDDAVETADASTPPGSAAIATDPATTPATEPSPETAPTTTSPTTTVTTTTSTTSTTTTSTTTTTTIAPTTTVAGSASALDVLAFITVENERGEGYDRSLFAYPGDLDGDGCDTRSEILQRDSLTPAQVEPAGCTVVAGDWHRRRLQISIAETSRTEAST